MRVEGRLNLLNHLFKKIEQQLEKLGFSKDHLKYSPHITLARIKYPQSHTPDIDVFLKSSYDPIDLSIDRVQFFASELLPSGPIYSLLKTFLGRINLRSSYVRRYKENKSFGISYHSN